MSERIQELAARATQRESNIERQQQFTLHKAKRIQQSAMELAVRIARAVEEAREEFNAALEADSGSMIEYFSKRDVPRGVKLIRGAYPAVNLTVTVDPDNQRVTVARILTDTAGQRTLPQEIFPLELEDNAVRISDGTRLLTENEFAERMIEYFA